MKTLTIKQPWASLIALGIKDVENRTKKTNFRGRILIHSGLHAEKEFYLDVLSPVQFNFLSKLCMLHRFQELPFSTIIGSVEIVDCVQNHPSIWAEKGVWNWVLANPIIWDKPIKNVSGKQSLWNYNLPEPILESVEVTSSIDFKLIYDPDGSIFKETYQEYRNFINSNGCINDMMTYIIDSICDQGYDHIIEGVGYVGVNGQRPKNGYCGIDVLGDFMMNGKPRFGASILKIPF